MHTFLGFQISLLETAVIELVWLYKLGLCNKLVLYAKTNQSFEDYN